MIDDSPLIIKDLYEFLEIYKENSGGYRVANSSIEHLLDKLEEHLLFATPLDFDHNDKDVLYWAFRDHPWPISLEQWSFKYFENTKEAAEEET